MKSVAIFACLVAFVAASASDWESFKNTHSKTYSNLLEEKTRYSIYQDNLKTIEEHNKNYDAGLVTWKMGVNQFADMTPEEFKATLPKWDEQALNAIHANATSTFDLPAGVSAPSSIDWRTKGAVTEVKNQGGCGGCWAFSAIGSFEAQYFIKNGQLLSFSEQNLIDCVTNNAGCGGGVIQYSFDYIRENGIELESDYPYTGQNGVCLFQSSLSKSTCSGYTNINYGDENGLLNAVGTVGPVSVALNADGFQFYSSGIYSDTSCSTAVNHGVLAVGYDSENGVDYWIIKNSWGTGFGENGYIKMIRGADICGLALYNSYPNL